MIITGTPLAGMVLGPVVDGIATVFETTTGLAHRVGVESLTVGGSTTSDL